MEDFLLRAPCAPRVAEETQAPAWIEQGIPWTDHGSGNGTGQAKRRILFNEFSKE